MQLYTDASSTIGFGGFYHGKWFCSPWPDELPSLNDKNLSMAFLEFYPIVEESASYYDEKFGEIDILTDARHGWRKNAKNSSSVAIGEKTHKVVSCQHVTKGDDVVSQKHERIGQDL